MICLDRRGGGHNTMLDSFSLAWRGQATRLGIVHGISSVWKERREGFLFAAGVEALGGRSV